MKLKEQDLNKSQKPQLNIGAVIARFFMIFKPKCTECGSKDSKVECYAGNPYAKNERWQTGRQCNNCINFWYK